MESKESLPTFMQGVRECIPTLLGYIGIGIAMGIVGNTAHLSIIEIGLLSALVYAGASQFIICVMLITMSPPSAIIATTFIVNLRHFLMSAALAPHFSAYSLLKNIGIGTLLTDESFGWLSYIPVCLLIALVVQEMIQKTESIPTVNWLNIAMVIPTLLTAIKTKSLLATVLVGIVSAGMMRWIF